MSKLGNLIDRREYDAKPSRLGVTFASGVRGMHRDVPVLGRVYVRLLGHTDVQQVEADTYARMRELGIQLDAITALSYEAERQARTLALAFRDPDNHDEPFGTVEDWQRVDADLLNSCAHVYGDTREELSPVPIPLDGDTTAAITAAVEKKSATLLRSYGVANLAAWLITTGGLPAISPTTKLPDGASSLANSP